MRITRRAALLGVGAALATPRVLRAQDGIAGLVAQVNRARLREDVFALSAFPTRWTGHADFGAVEDWVAEAFGPGVTRQPFQMPGGKVRHNIIAGDLNDPREMILVGGHYDSTSEREATDAPGANDNATGIAAMLEMQRILAPLALQRQIVFVAFAGEEQGLIGSTAAARVATTEGWPIALMLNLDMLGHRHRQPNAPMVIEYDQGNAVARNDAAARDFGQDAARLAAQHTTLATTHTDIWASDYMPFEAQGFACIGLYDGGAEDALYHTTQDRPDRVDYIRVEQATRLAVAIAAEAAGMA